MPHGLIGSVHLGAALAAIAIGAFVLLRPKAGRWHRRTGYAYAAAMTLLNLTALLLYRLTGTVNIFHYAAAVSLLTLGLGLGFAIRRRPAGIWLELHYRFMAWSYVGLLAALVAEVSTRLLRPWLLAHGSAARGTFWWMVALCTIAVVGVGGVCIEIVGRRAAARARSRLP